LSSDPVVLHKRRDTQSILARLSRIGVAILAGLLVVSVYLFLYAPPLVTAIFSFNSNDIQTLPFAHWTLKWYTALLNDPQMQSAIYYSLEAGLTAVAVGAVFGVAFALLIHRLRFAGRNVVQALLAAPLVTPGMVLGISLLVVFRSMGILPGFLTVVVGHASFITPLITFIVLQRLRTTDPTLEHASMDCGAGRIRTFWHVTLPGIRLALIFACLLGFTLSMDEIAVTYFLAGVQGTLPVYVWGLIRFGFSPEVNAVFSLIGGGLLLLILGTTAIVLVATRESRQSMHEQQRREQEGAAPAHLEGRAAAS
jgi:ABC-type spermidine/putrescine transport system permease subunit II